MTPKDSLCELLVLCWEGQVCHQTSVKSSQIFRFPLNLKRFAHRFLCASRTRPFQYRFTTTVIEWPAWTTALCRVCETQNSGKALLFFAKQESKYPRIPSDLKLSQKAAFNKSTRQCSSWDKCYHPSAECGLHSRMLQTSNSLATESV